IFILFHLSLPSRFPAPLKVSASHRFERRVAVNPALPTAMPFAVHSFLGKSGRLARSRGKGFFLRGSPPFLCLPDYNSSRSLRIFSRKLLYFIVSFIILTLILIV